MAEPRRLQWAILARAALTDTASAQQVWRAHALDEAVARVLEDPGVFGVPPTVRQAAADDLDRATEIGARLITRDDPEWPKDRFTVLAAPQSSGRDPVALWARGPARLDAAVETSIAVIGSRCSTGYGDRVTGELASELAARDWTIVSGAAFGIDGMAHRAALAVGATTVAVLACGVDRPYPAQHDRLLDRIAESGLVVSEYPPGVVARKQHFLDRNRLVAALARGVLVVEAGIRSGSANTVGWAGRFARPVFAVPGPISSAASTGCHAMIRDGRAELVTDIQHILDTLTD